MRLFKNAWFRRFARKENLSDEWLWDAVARAEKGLVDADLGGGVLKLRIARPGQGRSKGFRTIVFYREGDKAFFVYGFPKSAIDNLREDEKEQFKRAAKSVLALSGDEIHQLMANGQLEEVMQGGQEIPH